MIPVREHPRRGVDDVLMGLVEMVGPARTRSAGRWFVFCAAVGPIGGALTLGWLRPVPLDVRISAVLVVVAATGIAVDRLTRRPSNPADRPGNVHAVWLVPGAALTSAPTAAALLGLSVLIILTSGSAPLRHRALAAVTTGLGALAIAVARQLTGSPLSALAFGLPVLLGLGVLAATGLRLRRPGAPRSRRDGHRTAVEACAALTGGLIAVAMTVHPLVGLAGVAPMLLTGFALHWPDLTDRARTDTKTGLPNAGRWEELSREALAGCDRRHRPAALLIIDIDHFKRINDNFGHLAGDSILAAVAADIRAELGPDDLVGRFGGEEFVVTTIGRPQPGSIALAERIRERLARTRHQVVNREGITTTAGPVTCTIGVAGTELLGYEHTVLLRRADAALAGGKLGGRNQVRSATNWITPERVLRAPEDAPTQPDNWTQWRSPVRGRAAGIRPAERSLAVIPGQRTRLDG